MGGALFCLAFVGMFLSPMGLQKYRERKELRFVNKLLRRYGLPQRFSIRQV